MKFSINHKVFDYIARSPKKFSKNGISFISRKCDKFFLGFVIPKSLGSASLRNRFKRRCRSVLQQFNKNAGSLSFGVIVKPKIININYDDIDQSIALWIDSLKKTSS